jgi:hypothetical protein
LALALLAGVVVGVEVGAAALDLHAAVLVPGLIAAILRNSDLSFCAS